MKDLRDLKDLTIRDVQPTNDEQTVSASYPRKGARPNVGANTEAP